MTTTQPNTTEDRFAHTPDRTADKIYRSSQPLSESWRIDTTVTNLNEVTRLARLHWTTLRANGWAASTPVSVLVQKDTDTPSVVYTFRYNDDPSKEAASKDEQVQNILTQIADLASDPSFEKGGYAEAYQGFDSQRFPAYGGLELLRGKCDCTVELFGREGESVKVNGLNGFVLMHRAPGQDVDGDSNREMFVQIVDHGSDCPTFTVDAFHTALGLDVEDTDGVRIGQNKELPQYGLIRAKQHDSDFPAVAMWVVHWRISTTKLGSFITDPNTPLVFGPTTVMHYPPVGTRFHASTGPVDLIHEQTGKVVGKLTPGELTAFDIVVTKDDEIPSAYFNTAPQELIDLFDQLTL